MTFAYDDDTSPSFAAWQAGKRSDDFNGTHVRAHAHSRATVVAISGEVDVSNVDLIRARVCRFIAVGPALILDMSNVDFFDVNGIRALLTINRQCTQAGVPWALVTSEAVTLLLDLGDVDDVIPAVDSVAEALQLFAERTRARERFHRLVT